MIATNYFSAEEEIIKQLKEVVTGIAEVYTPFSTADMLESSQKSPALHVIYSGDVVSGNDAGNNTRQVIYQKWLVVLSIRTARAQLKDTTDARLMAGELIPKIIQALQGWKPNESMQPLARINAPPVGYSSSFCYFPFMFQGRLLT